MAGRLTIQRAPRGLPDLLGMKASGDAPTELAETIFGAVDLTGLYTVDRRVVVSGTTANVASTGGWNVTGGETTVPAGQLWDVRNITIQKATVPAGTTYTVVPAVDRFSLSQFLALGQPNTAVGGANVGLYMGVQFNPGTLVLSPQDRVGLLAQQFVGVASAFVILVEYVAYLM